MRRYPKLCIMLFLLACSCSSDYLDIKPNKALVVPTELEHFQALLDNVSFAMNQGPGLQLLATDEYIHPPENLANLSAVNRNSYLWEADIYEGKMVQDWEYPYKAIFNANIALDGLNKINPDSTSQQQWNQIYGSALFYRAFSLYNIAEVFAAPYDKATASSLPGVPIRLSMDINETVGRGTLQQTYDRIIQDLTKAETLLPRSTPYVNRPCGIAVKALLARMYLSMGLYDQALLASSDVLQSKNQLLDYNTLDTNAYRPFPNPFKGANPEIIFYYLASSYELYTSWLTNVDTTLYRSYAPEDLRKKCFFVLREGNVTGFQGSYTGESSLFTGLLTDEIYLIRAECYARSGMTALALADLNTLLRNRYRKGSFTELTATDDTILDLVLFERRKQLFARGLRWSDLRRLNKDPRYALTLMRVVNGKTYTLPPNDNRYVFPIPDDEIRLSGIEQNPR